MPSAMDAVSVPIVRSPVSDFLCTRNKTENVVSLAQAGRIGIHEADGCGVSEGERGGPGEATSRESDDGCAVGGGVCGRGAHADPGGEEADAAVQNDGGLIER